MRTTVRWVSGCLVVIALCDCGPAFAQAPPSANDTQALRQDIAQLRIIHVDPRFTRTSANADLYAPIRPGTDIAFLGGLINYILEQRLYNEAYVREYTNAAMLIDPGYGFTNAYGLRWDAPQETAYPATFVIDRDGTIRFARVSLEHGGRTPVADVLKALAATTMR